MPAIAPALFRRVKNRREVSTSFVEDGFHGTGAMTFGKGFSHAMPRNASQSASVSFAMSSTTATPLRW